MTSFVRFNTLFLSAEDRTIERLGAVYDDRPRMRELVHSLTEGVLDESRIRGKRILLKPNWVLHDRTPADPVCLRTHNEFILAAIEVLLPLRPSMITVGDAPIQGCRWEQVVNEGFLWEVKRLSDDSGVPVEVVDFRRVIFDTNGNSVGLERAPISDYLIFDVGERSFLEPITSAEEARFRVAHYDHRRLAEVHRKGVHKYCITRKVFDADVVISMPKAKTHEKSGITAALKNLVGINGDKDYLPHHRIGGTEEGGDSYPGRSTLRSLAERALDIANQNTGRPSFRVWQKAALVLWKASHPAPTQGIGAAWHGNDTTWRMVLDLNQVILYGRPDGTLADSPQREIYTLLDGIVGGQGNGPLFPVPLPLGVAGFTNNSALIDLCLTHLMCFDPERIPLITNAFQVYPGPDAEITVNGRKVTAAECATWAIETLPAPGWKDHLSAGSTHRKHRSMAVSSVASIFPETETKKHHDRHP
jgi:uncharacterized protein (DUF362 family)